MTLKNHFSNLWARTHPVFLICIKNAHPLLNQVVRQWSRNINWIYSEQRLERGHALNCSHQLYKNQENITKTLGQGLSRFYLSISFFCSLYRIFQSFELLKGVRVSLGFELHLFRLFIFALARCEPTRLELVCSNDQSLLNSYDQQLLFFSFFSFLSYFLLAFSQTIFFLGFYEWLRSNFKW